MIRHAEPRRSELYSSPPPRQADITRRLYHFLRLSAPFRHIFRADYCHFDGFAIATPPRRRASFPSISSRRHISHYADFADYYFIIFAAFRHYHRVFSFRHDELFSEPLLTFHFHLLLFDRLLRRSAIDCRHAADFHFRRHQIPRHITPRHC
jgi:hypothetical protein